MRPPMMSVSASGGALVGDVHGVDAGAQSLNFSAFMWVPLPTPAEA